MHLTKSDILAILNWMKTKPYYQSMLQKFGVKKTLLEYLKDKSEKRLPYILLALKNRNLHRPKFKYGKNYYKSLVK